MDFTGARQIVQSAISPVAAANLQLRRDALIVGGLAETALGNDETALELLLTLRGEMDHHR